MKKTYFEVAEGSGSFGVNHAFGDSLPIEPGQFIDEDGVLQQHRASGAGGQGVGVVVDRVAPSGGQAVGLPFGVLEVVDLVSGLVPARHLPVDD